MNFNQYTIKSQEAINKAVEIAQANQQQSIEPAHILKGMFSVDENVIQFLFKKLNIAPQRIQEVNDALVLAYPKVQGGDPFFSRDSNQVFQKASALLSTFKDEFITVDHLLLAILAGSDKTASMLKDAGLKEKDLKAAVFALRGDQKVTDQNAEATYQSLAKFARNLND
jgi:ATP-dependent Clp protease ATP-binding subunit ClpB